MGRRAHSDVSEMPLRRKYASAVSVDRFSEYSLHADYRSGYKDSEYLFINYCLSKDYCVSAVIEHYLCWVISVILCVQLLKCSKIHVGVYKFHYHLSSYFEVI